MLGQGKYGTVTRARHKRLGSMVALKSVVDPHFTCNSSETSSEGSSDLSFVSRKNSALYHEARVLASLNHPCLVSLVEICVGVNGLLGLALEDLGGMTLKGLVEKKRYLGLCECLVGCVVGHIAKALSYLHSRGYLHRDVKPGNIMVENTNNCFPNAKLIDLGLCIQYSADKPPNSSAGRAGTLVYMAPELMRPNTEYGPESDLFSLGASAYYGLVGEKPFTAYTRGSGGCSTTSSVHGLLAQHMDSLDSLSTDTAQVKWAYLYVLMPEYHPWVR